MGDFDTGVVLLLFAKDRYRGGAFGEVAGISFGGVESFEELKDFCRGEGDSGRGQPFDPGIGEVGDELTDIFDRADVLLLTEPALITGFTPVGEVLLVERLAIELGGEDFFDGGEFIQPGKDLPASFAIVQTEINFFTGIAGKTGEFAMESIFRMAVVMVCLCGVFARRDALNDNFVIHPAILAREGKRT